MEPTYDIFKRRDDSYPFWITAVETLEEAKERTAKYALVVPGSTLFTRREKGLSLSVSPQRMKSAESRLIWFMPQSWNSMHHGTAA